MFEAMRSTSMFVHNDYVRSNDDLCQHEAFQHRCGFGSNIMRPRSVHLQAGLIPQKSKRACCLLCMSQQPLMSREWCSQLFNLAMFADLLYLLRDQ